MENLLASMNFRDRCVRKVWDDYRFVESRVHEEYHLLKFANAVIEGAWRVLSQLVSKTTGRRRRRLP